MPWQPDDVIRSGSWLYDGTITGRVRILKIKGDGPNIVETDEEESGHSPTDNDGCYYVAEYGLPILGRPTCGSRGFATPQEATHHAEETLPSPVVWDDKLQE